MTEAPTAYTTTDEAWLAQESNRLRTMDTLTAGFTEQDLAPVLQEAASDRSDGSAVTLLDVGAAASVTVEQLCAGAGVDYYALDPNPVFLEQRATPADRKILGTLQTAPLPSSKFDLMHGRAVVAWQKEPTIFIARMLQAARDTAVFTEFDWSTARLHSDDPQIHNSAQVLLHTALHILTTAGFDENLGGRLGHLIDATAREWDIVCSRENTHPHQLPEDDYRDVVLNTLDALLGMARQARGGRPIPDEAAVREHMEIVKKAPAGSLRMRLPALVTEVVHIAWRPQPVRRVSSFPLLATDQH